ncbi:amidohydrolase [Rossellomorea vietnamensis]|uniref:Amidohydrolase n=1 Tax=Rossellomorea aquimaris TaxID=189382 RepID=A0A5D4U167_9BACI|nr:amidohydrolase [Rossellomorea aquimaris]TYS80959.1 amidohydrolase [Rossellomorea aquimaris]
MNKQCADIIIKSDSIFTADRDLPLQGAVAVKGDTILAIGSEEELGQYKGSHTKEIEAYGKLVTPGFHDFHVHLWLGAMFQEYASLTFCGSEEEAADRIAQYAEQHPNDPWVLGFGWHHVRWPGQKLPARHSLDQRIKDRPVFLLNEEAHSAWLNTKALEILGIDEMTPEPPFGVIEKDEDGKPTGFLYETAVGLAVEAFNLPSEKKHKLMKSFLEKAGRLGITSIGDMLPLPGFTLGDLEEYKRFEDEGKLTVRIHFLAPLDGELEKLSYYNRFDSDKLQLSGLKQFIDGVPLTYTGYLLEPYSDRPSTNGGTIYSRETYFKWIEEADKKGYRVRLHACGDAAVRLALDAFQHARNVNGPRDSRHTIEHIEVIHPDDISRFSELGVLPSMQPEHLSSSSMESHEYIDRLGPDRLPYTWPIGELEKSGAQLVFGSDYPIVELNPMLGIYRAVTRKHEDGTPFGGWNPQHKISLAKALTHFTSSPAYGNFRENDLGTLQAGKKADIAILDRNLFECEPEEIKECKVLWTIMDGRIVYDINNPKA